MGCQFKLMIVELYKVNIVVMMNFYGSVVKVVGGKYVSVMLIINKLFVDFYDFELILIVVKMVGQVDFVIVNGIGYDGWMNKVVYLM